MEKTTIYLTDELRTSLQRHLRRTGTRQSDVVREALASYLTAHEPGLPSSIGVVDEGDVDASRYEDDLVEAWGTRPTATSKDDVSDNDAHGVRE